MRVLVACEFSGTVRDAFIRAGHNAVSCDVLPTESDGPHIQCDVLKVINDGWDLMIAHPPCTYLTVSANRWQHDHWVKKKRHKEHWHDGSRHRKERVAALKFFRKLLEAPIHKVCVENPIGVASSYIRKPDQIIHPWQFCHLEQKTTCLWLKGLPKLIPTSPDAKELMMTFPKSLRERIKYMPKTDDRWKKRSLTYQGIADAMADQWGEVDLFA